MCIKIEYNSLIKQEMKAQDQQQRGKLTLETDVRDGYFNVNFRNKLVRRKPEAQVKVQAFMERSFRILMLSFNWFTQHS
jgi:hypothetical protein